MQHMPFKSYSDCKVTADGAGAKATSSGAYYTVVNDWNERAVKMLSLRFVLYETCAISPSTQYT